MAHTENSGEAGVPSNSQSTHTTSNSLAAEDIIESNKAMFSACKEVLQKTLTSMGSQLHEHSKCQMEQVHRLIEAVTQMISSHNANKLAARSTAHPENSDNSDPGEDDEENDRQNRDRSIYNETNLAASFLSHQQVRTGNNR